jgi:hypothetical protein
MTCAERMAQWRKNPRLYERYNWFHSREHAGRVTGGHRGRKASLRHASPECRQQRQSPNLRNTSTAREQQLSGNYGPILCRKWVSMSAFYVPLRPKSLDYMKIQQKEQRIGFIFSFYIIFFYFVSLCPPSSLISSSSVSPSPFFFLFACYTHSFILPLHPHLPFLIFSSSFLHFSSLVSPLTFLHLFKEIHHAVSMNSRLPTL